MLDECGYDHVTHFFLNFGPASYLGMGEAMQIKFGVWTDIDKYWCMHQTYPGSGCVQGYRLSYSGKLIGSHMFAAEWHQRQ